MPGCASAAARGEDLSKVRIVTDQPGCDFEFAASLEECLTLLSTVESSGWEDSCTPANLIGSTSNEARPIIPDTHRDSEAVFDRFEVDHVGLRIRLPACASCFNGLGCGALFLGVFDQHQLGVHVLDEPQNDIHRDSHAIRFPIPSCGAHLEPLLQSHVCLPQT